MKKFLLKILLFSVCVISIIIALLMIPDTELIVGRKKAYLQKNAFKSYDLLILGSSRAQHTFNPDVYTGNLKIYNAGEDGHGLPSNYLMIKILVEKYHLKISKLLLEVDEYAFMGTAGFSRQFRDDYFVTDLEDKEVFDAFKRYRGEFYAYSLKYFPHLANLFYCDFVKLIKNGIMSFRTVVPKIEDVYIDHINKAAVNKGYVPVAPGKNIKLTNQYFVTQDDDVEYFNKLVSFCKAQHIEIFFYRAPVLNCQMVHSAPFDKFIKDFTITHGIKYFDYKCKYQWPGYYEDQNHSGAEISPYLTKNLLKDLNLN